MSGEILDVVVAECPDDDRHHSFLRSPDRYARTRRSKWRISKQQGPIQGGLRSIYLVFDQRLQDPDDMRDDCEYCRGTGWVCENHADQPAFECLRCDGAGVTCECNPEGALPGAVQLLSAAPTYVLRSRTADGVPLYFGELGPTVAREDAIEYSADEIERRRLTASYLFDLDVEAIETGRLA
jgi:hypothetical protein